MSHSSLLLARDDEFDPQDLSFVKKMAAVGDSYSAGIGAGNRLGSAFDFLDPASDFACSRYDHSYPYLVNTDERLGDAGSRTFQFKSCSGAVISDVVNKQIPTIDSNQQVILLSAGGNDVELLNILNQCVYQLGVFTPAQVLLLKIEAINRKLEWAEDFNWDALARGCDGQLDYTEALINGNAFSSSLDQVIQKTRAKLSSDGMLYYTGYAKFFSEETSECDTVSWSSWLFKLHDIQRPYEYLTQARRSRMNKLVEAVNSKISDAVNRASSDQIKFVNYDKYVGDWHGRYCEAGVDESTKESNTRYGLMFYELSTLDIFGSSPWKRSTTGTLEGTNEGFQNQLAQITLLADPDAHLNLPSGVSTSDVGTASVASVANDMETSAVSFEIPNFLPDGYGRTFHPQVMLHQIIANLVIYHMVDRQAQSKGIPAVPEVDSIDSCPYIPPEGGASPGSQPDPAYSDPHSSKEQQIALASYIHPLADKDAWQRMYAMDKNKVSVLVANVLNGPDAKMNDDWKGAIMSAHATGKTIIGYVRTGYLGVSQQQFKTRLGSGRLSDWVAQIEQDVDMWYSLYGNQMGGIFFDEGWNQCGDGDKYANLYEYINFNTKRKYPGAYTVLNPGDFMPKCFENSSDTLLTFESSFERYIDDSIYKPNGWTAKDARKNWHIIYNVPKSEIGRIAALARQRGAGIIEITNDIMPNPYDNLPAADYMLEVMNSVNGGSTYVAPDPGFPHNTDSPPGGNPTDLTITGFDYTSASLKWNAIGDSFKVSVGSHVYNFPGDMKEATIGGLEPATSYSFSVTALGPGGNNWITTESQTVNTKPLPDGKTIINYSSKPSGGSTIVQADVLVPYAFVRVYLWEHANCDLPDTPAWPITDSTAANYICGTYMVEGETLYKYNAQIPEGFTNAPWSWAPVGPVNITTDGYTITWNIPIGTSTIDTSKFVIQAEGYGPSTNIFQPEPNTLEYDCKGSSMCSTPDLLKWCDHAVNTLQRNDDASYTNFNNTLTGNCWGDQTRGCGVFIQSFGGEKCSISGNDMWNAYQNIRKIGGCKKCGSWHRKDGCLVTINYVSECNNHS